MSKGFQCWGKAEITGCLGKKCYTILEYVSKNERSYFCNCDYIKSLRVLIYIYTTLTVKELFLFLLFTIVRLAYYLSWQ